MSLPHNPRAAQLLELVRRHPPENEEDRGRLIRALAGTLATVATALPHELVSIFAETEAKSLTADLLDRVGMHRLRLGDAQRRQAEIGKPVFGPLRVNAAKPTGEIFDVEGRVCPVWEGICEGEKLGLLIASFGGGPVPDHPLNLVQTAGFSYLPGLCCRVWVDAHSPGRIALVPRLQIEAGGKLELRVVAAGCLDANPESDTPVPRPLFASRIPETCFN